MNDISQPPAGLASPPSTQGDREALDNWLNEGGHLSTSADAGTMDLATLPSEEGTLRDMAALFISDFVNGRVGQHHNTFQHRARVLRQLTAKLRATTFTAEVSRVESTGARGIARSGRDVPSAKAAAQYAGAS